MQLTNSLKNGVETSYSYDNNGNLLGELAFGTVKHYSYNQRNYMTSVIHNGVMQLAYVYDGNGDRVRETAYKNGTASSPTTYLNDTVGLTQVFIMAKNGVQTVNRFGLDLVAQDKQGATRLYLATDGLGSVRVETQGQNAVAAKLYNPFGVVLEGYGTSQTTYGYTGEQFNSTSGLLYLRARYYNPNLKLFTQKDPFSGVQTIPATMHGYSYGHNNPIIYIDPSGQIVVNVAGMVTGTVAGAIIGGGVDALTQLALTGQVDWRSVGASALGGAVQGGICGVTVGLGCVIIGGAAGGAVNSIARDLLDVDRDGCTCIDWGNAARDAAVSVATAGAFHGLGKAVTKITNYYNIGIPFTYVNERVSFNPLFSGKFTIYDDLTPIADYQRHHPIGGGFIKHLPNYSETWFKDWYKYKALTILMYGGLGSESGALRGSPHWLVNQIQKQQNPLKHLRAYRALGFNEMEQVGIAQLWELGEIGFNRNRVISYLFERSLIDSRLWASNSATNLGNQGQFGSLYDMPSTNPCNE